MNSLSQPAVFPQYAGHGLMWSSGDSTITELRKKFPFS